MNLSFLYLFEVILGKSFSSMLGKLRCREGALNQCKLTITVNGKRVTDVCSNRTRLNMPLQTESYLPLVFTLSSLTFIYMIKQHVDINQSAENRSGVVIKLGFKYDTQKTSNKHIQKKQENTNEKCCCFYLYQ